MICPINFGVKLSGKRSAGNPHAAFEEAGVGNVTKGVGLRTAVKVAGNTPNPKEGAPVLDSINDGFLNWLNAEVSQTV